MKKFYFFSFLFFIPYLVKSQEISLTHSGTQFDAFENPVQQSFDKDYSRKYAVSVFPAINLIVYFKGDAKTTFSKFLFDHTISNTNITAIGEAKTNYLNLKGNIYLFNYRILQTVDYNRELGFSLQFRDEAQANITNETFALLGSFKNFTQNNYTDIFNNNGVNQSYWQWGVNYRENYNDRWGFGGKFSILNGITYSKIDITSSNLEITSNNSYEAGLKGSYVSSFGMDSLNIKKFLTPSLKNLGLAVSGGVSYTTKKGIYVTLNIKDLGFIHWNKSTEIYNFNDTVKVYNTNSQDANNEFFNGFNGILNTHSNAKKYFRSIDSKIDFAISKSFNFYTPVVAFSKSLFRDYGKIALLNNFRKNAFNIGINPIYDFQTGWNLGTQILIKSPNAEFYLGSENIFSNYNFSKVYLKKDETLSKGDPLASFYIGITMKFGKKMQNIGNADEIDGLNDKETGYVVRLSKKERRALQKKNQKTNKKRKKNN